MTPDELAALHPRLYHLTDPANLSSIRAHGLLSPEAMCDRCGLEGEKRDAILARRRPAATAVCDGFLVNDNAPLSEARLRRVLDDGLSPEDWLRMLNGRVFFWTDAHRAERPRNARNNRDRDRVLLAFDTLSLAHAHASRMAICPINSGATVHAPPRRGRHTFAPVEGLDYGSWRRARRERGYKKGLDAIQEVTVLFAVPDAAAHLLEVAP